VVKGVLKLKAAAPFSRPVNEEEVPGYGAAVKQPMDLGSVLEKLKNAEYTSLGGECACVCVCVCVCVAAVNVAWGFIVI